MKINNVVYNAAAGAFEGRVDIVRDGKSFRYPCQVPGPVTMDARRVRAGLIRHAQRMSDSSATLWSEI